MTLRLQTVSMSLIGKSLLVHIVHIWAFYAVFELNMLLIVITELLGYIPVYFGILSYIIVH